MGTELKSYERQDYETDVSWRAFQAFRDAGLGREKLATYRLVYGHPEAKAPPGFITAWAKANHWNERTVEWDREVDRVRREALLNDHVTRDELHVKTLRGLGQTLMEALAKKDPLEMTMRDILQGLELVIDKERLIAGEETDRVGVVGGNTVNFLMGRFVADPELRAKVTNAKTDEELIEVLEENVGPEIAGLISAGDGSGSP